MSASYVERKEELHIYRVVSKNESWDNPDELIEKVSYELWIGDTYVCGFDSFEELVRRGEEYIGDW